MSRLQLKLEREDGGDVTLRGFVAMLNNARLVLEELDSAISQQPHGSLAWYVTDLRYSSATAVVESRPKRPEADKRLTVMVEENFVNGLHAVETTETMPPYFSALDLGRVSRIANQLADEETFTAARLDAEQDTVASITANAVRNIKNLLRPKYKTIGSVRGKLEMINVHGAARFNVYEAATNRAVSCAFDLERLDEVSAALRRRVIVSGIVHRNANGDAIKVEKPDIRVVDDSEIPKTQDMIGLVPDFTGDLSSAEYVRQLRTNG